MHVLATMRSTRLQDRMTWLSLLVVVYHLTSIRALQVNVGLASQTPPVAIAGSPYNFTVATDTFDEPLSTLTLTAQGLPPWLSLDSKLASFTGTPPSDLGAGSTQVSLAAKDGTGASATDSFQLVTTTTPFPKVQYNLADQLTNSSLGPYCVLHASGPYHGMLRIPPGYSFSVTFRPDSFVSPSGGMLYYSAHQVGFAELPSWLHFDNTTLTLSGTVPPSLAQDGQLIFPIEIDASLIPGTAETSDSISILVAQHQLDLPNPVMVGPIVTATEAFTYKIPLDGLQLDATNATMADIQQISVTIPPATPWLQFNASSSTLYGIPPFANSSDANFTLPVVFTDIYNDTAAGNLSVVVKPSAFFNMTTLPDLDVIAGKNYTTSLAPYIKTVPLTSQLTVLAVPASSASWLTYNPNNLSISGSVPLTATNGTNVQLSIKDAGSGKTSVAGFNVVVFPANTTQLPGSTSTFGADSAATATASGSGSGFGSNATGSPSAADAAQAAKDVQSRNIVLGVVFGGLLLALLLLLLLCCCRRRRRQAKSKREEEALVEKRRRERQRKSDDEILGIGHQHGDHDYRDASDFGLDDDASTITSSSAGDHKKLTQKMADKLHIGGQGGSKGHSNAFLGLGLVPFILRGGRRKGAGKGQRLQEYEEKSTHSNLSSRPPTQWRSNLMAAFRRSLSSIGAFGRSRSGSPSSAAAGGLSEQRAGRDDNLHPGFGSSIRILDTQHENPSWVSNQPTLSEAPVQHPIAVRRDAGGQSMCDGREDTQDLEEGSVVDFSNTRSSWETSSIFYSERDRASMGASSSWLGTQGSRPSQAGGLTSIDESSRPSSFDSNAVPPLPLLPQAAHLQDAHRDLESARNFDTGANSRRSSIGSITSNEGANSTQYGRRIAFTRSDASLLSPSPTRAHFDATSGRTESREFSDAENDFSTANAPAGQAAPFSAPRPSGQEKRVLSIGSPALNRLGHPSPLHMNLGPAWSTLQSPMARVPRLPPVRQEDYAFDPREMPLAFVPLSHTFTEHEDEDDQRHVSTLTRGDGANEKLHLRDFTHARVYSQQKTPQRHASRSPSYGDEDVNEHDAPEETPTRPVAPPPLVSTPTLRLIVPSSPVQRR